MKTLLIYETIPEKIDIYLLPEAPEWLRKVNQLYINNMGLSDAEVALLNRVGDAICPTSKYWMDPDDPLAGTWAQYQIESGKPLQGLDDSVLLVQCGFLL